MFKKKYTGALATPEGVEDCCFVITANLSEGLPEIFEGLWGSVNLKEVVALVREEMRNEEELILENAKKIRNLDSRLLILLALDVKCHQAQKFMHGCDMRKKHFSEGADLLLKSVLQLCEDYPHKTVHEVFMGMSL